MGLTGGVQDSIIYDGFGNITSESNASARGELGFQGGRYDAATRNWVYGVRELNPSTLQWMTQDPSGLGPDINPYRYVGNDPTNATDPSGLESIEVENNTVYWKPTYAGKDKRFRIGTADSTGWVSLDPDYGGNGGYSVSLSRLSSLAQGVDPTCDGDPSSVIAKYLKDEAPKLRDYRKPQGKMVDCLAGPPPINVSMSWSLAREQAVDGISEAGRNGGKAVVLVVAAPFMLSGCSRQTAPTTPAPSLAEVLANPTVNAALRQAWEDSNPNAPEVRMGMPGSTKHEQGDWITWDGTRLNVVRVPAGTRDGLASIVGTKPPDAIAWFHTHPNTAAEGYGADASPADIAFTNNPRVRVPGIIETHEGRKIISVTP